MEEWKKIYEEKIVFETLNEEEYTFGENEVMLEESIKEKLKKDMKNYKIWLNKMLEDNNIPYKNKLKYESTLIDTFTKGGEYLIEIYVEKHNEEDAKELIRMYNEATVEDYQEDICSIEANEEELNNIYGSYDELNRANENEANLIANKLMKIFFLILAILALGPSLGIFITYIIR